MIVIVGLVILVAAIVAGLAGARRTARRGSAARRGLRQSRQESAAASQARDNLIGQPAAAHAYAANPPGNPVPRGDSPLPLDDDERQTSESRQEDCA